jgi:hypothetical protein
MAEYDISNANGNAFANTYSGGYYFSWADAMSRFAAQTGTGYSDYRNAGKSIGGINYHLPVEGEWWSVVPGNDTEIWNFDSGSGTYKNTYISSKWGYNSTTKGGVIESSYWKRISSLELHAIRFLGTDFCSAWKYKWNGNTLTIYATLIGLISNSSSSASSWYNSNWSSITWGNNESAGAVQRSLYLVGERANTGANSGSGSTNATSVGSWGFYWSASDTDHAAYGNVGNALYLGSGSANVRWAYKGYGFHVRPFKDN